VALENNFDSFLPPAMAQKAEELGVRKANLPFFKVLMLAILAGAFIALGAAFSTTTLAGSAALPYGVARLLAGSWLWVARSCLLVIV